MSLLNTNLPRVDNLHFCSSAGQNMSLKIGVIGGFTRKVGFKQPGLSFPYQIQYRQRSKYTEEIQNSKGAEYSKWTDWKNAVQVGGIPIDSTETALPANSWNKANKGVNTTSDYLTFYEFSNYKIPDSYQERQFEFRLRTYDKAWNTHGPWTSFILTVVKLPDIQDFKLVEQSNGYMTCLFNRKGPYKGLTFYANSIIDAQNININMDNGPQKIYSSSSTRIQSRTGYTKQAVYLENLTRSVVGSEALDCQFYLQIDGFKISLDGNYIVNDYSQVDTGKVDILENSVVWDENLGSYQIQVYYGGTPAQDSISCYIDYTYNGVVYTIQPTTKVRTYRSSSHQLWTYTFYPPIGVSFKVKAKWKYTSSTTYSAGSGFSQTALKGAGYRLTFFDEIDGAMVWGKTTTGITAQPTIVSSLPFGRKRPMAVFGKGENVNITLNGTIIDKTGYYGGKYAMRKAWEDIANRGNRLFVYRNHTGLWLKVAITNITLTKTETKDLYTVSVSMMEVA